MLLKNYKLHLAIVVLWYFIYTLNHYAFDPLSHKSYISLIFLPAGLRIFLATVYGIKAWLGLFLGAILTGLIYLDYPIEHVVVFSFFSATSPILGAYTVNYFNSLGDHLEHLTIQSALMIGISYGIYCSFFHNFYVFLLHKLSFYEFLLDFMAMFIGDLTGSMIFLTVLSSQRHLIIKYFDK